MKKIIIFIFFYSLSLKNIIAIDENNLKSENIPQTQILRIVTDQFFQDLFTKFGIIFKGAVNIVEFRQNETEELTRIFQEVCKKSDVFKKKNLPNYEPQIIVSSRDMNQFERTICLNRFEKIKIGYYAFIILSQKIQNQSKNQSEEFSLQKNEMSYSIDFSSQDFFLAMTKNLFDENLFSFAKNSFKKWNEISTFLPEREIKIYGPGSNSPFFFFLKNSILSPICLKQKFYSFRFKEIDFEESLKFCSELRIDSIYIEDDSGSRLSSERIMSDKTSFFIVPFHIYQRMNSRNKNFLEVHNFDGINPTEENIKNSRYRFSWPIYIFVEKDLLKSSQLAKSFIDEIKSENSSGPRGVLREYGLIPN